MRRIGEILELWRYPVSSVAGETVDEVYISPDGIVGDRQFALLDRATGLPAAPEQEPRWRPALFLTCETSADQIPQIGFPDGFRCSLADAALPQRLTDYFGFPVEIGAYGLKTSHWRTDFPAAVNRYAPAPLHVLTTGSLTKLSQIGALTETDRRRFRPSMLIDSGEESGFLENDWIGMTLQIGSLRAVVTEVTKRCGMTLIAQPGITDQPDILRNILRHNKRSLGIYCKVEHAASIRLGDAVYIAS